MANTFEISCFSKRGALELIKVYESMGFKKEGNVREEKRVVWIKFSGEWK